MEQTCVQFSLWKSSGLRTDFVGLMRDNSFDGLIEYILIKACFQVFTS